MSTQLPQHPSVGLVVARNACDFDRQAVDEGAVSLVDMLGHSMKAVALRKGATLQYSFTSNLECDATLFVGLVPTPATVATCASKSASMVVSLWWSR